MHENRVTPADLRGLLGLKSRMTVKRYLEGDRVPDGRVLRKLTDLTGGRVRREDFLDKRPPKCAAVVPTRDGGTRLVFPWSCSDAAAGYEKPCRGRRATRGFGRLSWPKHHTALRCESVLADRGPSDSPRPRSTTSKRLRVSIRNCGSCSRASPAPKAGTPRSSRPRASFQEASTLRAVSRPLASAGL